MVITGEVVKAAATCSQEKVLKIIKEHFNISPYKEESTIAHFYNAAKFGKGEVLQKLLAEVVNPDFKNIRHVSPLWIAATNGHFRAVQILLDTRVVDVNSQSISGRPPLFWAAAHGYQNIIELLIQFRVDTTLVDVDGNSPLSIAKQ